MDQPCEYLDVLRLSADAIEEILRRLQAKEGADPRSRSRQMPRFPFAGHKLLLEIAYPTPDHFGAYRAISRNLSAGGLALIHGKFVYPGSHCEVILRDRDDVEHRIAGLIIRCGHLQGRVHDVGVAFEAPLDVDLFVETPKTDGGMADAA